MNNIKLKWVVLSPRSAFTRCNNNNLSLRFNKSPQFQPCFFGHELQMKLALTLFYQRVKLSSYIIHLSNRKPLTKRGGAFCLMLFPLAVIRSNEMKTLPSGTLKNAAHSHTLPETTMRILSTSIRGVHDGNPQLDNL